MSVLDISRVPVSCFARDDGALAVLEAPAVPFAIARVFTVTAQDGAVRGRHAHKECSQLLFCPTGAIDAVADDGERRATFRLDQASHAVLVPPGLWLELVWRSAGAVLIVLCDQPYDEADYLRDWKAYVAWRRDTEESTA